MISRHPKPRSSTIDIAKGLGILLIVLGHNTIFTADFKSLAGLLTSFRVPLFFFMSGVTFSVRDRSLSNMAFERADAWLKPCAVVLSVIGLIKVALGLGTFENLLLSLTFATGFTFAWPPLWFLPHLWLVYVTSTALLIYVETAVNTVLKQVMLLVFLGFSGFFFLQVFNSTYENPLCSKQLVFSTKLFNCGLPYSADILMITCLFFLAGYFLSDLVKKFKPNLVDPLLSALVLTLLYSIYPMPLDLNARQYQDCFVSPLLAFCGIYLTLSICAYLAKLEVATRVFSYFARASLFILIFHAPILYGLIKILQRLMVAEWLIGVLAFVLPISISILLFSICKKSKLLSALMLPIKL